MTKTLIVHGLDGSPAPHWQAWWAATDPTALMVDLPQPHHPLPEAWEAELAGMILRHPDSIVVGHSLGAVVIARILAKWPQLRIGAAMLVAPAETLGSDRIGHFGPIPEHAFDVPALVVASTTDPWMSLRRADGLARSWGADLINLGAAGHINAAAGYGPWPQGKTLRDHLVARITPALRVAAAPLPRKAAR